MTVEYSGSGTSFTHGTTQNRAGDKGVWGKRGGLPKLRAPFPMFSIYNKPMASIHNPLSSFDYDPKRLTAITFSDQRHDEVIKLVLRSHPIVNLPWFLITIIGLLIPVGLHTLVIQTELIPTTTYLYNLFSSAEINLMYVLYYLGIFYFALYNFLGWYFNVLVITNQRVVDFNYDPPFNRQTTQAQLEEVQDVRQTQRGTLAIAFNYGDIFIQTAGTKQNILLRKIPKPHQTHSIIVDQLP